MRRPDTEPARRVNRRRSCVGNPRIHAFDAGNGAACIERQQARKVVGLAIGKPQRDRVGLARGSPAAAEFARRLPIRGDKGCIESAQACVAGGAGDVGDRHVRFAQQLLGEQQPARRRDIQRTGTNLLVEQATQVAFADAYTGGEFAQRMFIKRALFDQPQRTGHQRAARAMHGRTGCRLGSTAQAGSESRCRCRRRTRVVNDVA